VATYRALTWIESDTTDLLPALAFPADANHTARVERVSLALHQLGVGVFWIDEAGQVTLDAPWVL